MDKWVKSGVSIAVAMILSGCSVSKDGDFWGVGDYSEPGTPGYDVSPAAVEFSLLPSTLEGCQSSVTLMSSMEVIGTLEYQASKAVLNINLPDDQLILNTTCTDANSEQFEMKGYYNHFQGVSQELEVSPIAHVTASYYDFFASNGDLTGSESVFIGVAENAVGEFFDVDLLATQVEQVSYPVTFVSDYFMIDSIASAMIQYPMSLHSDSGYGVVDSFFSNVARDLSSEGKLDGSETLQSGVTNLEITLPDSSVVLMDTYTYLNEVMRHAGSLANGYLNDLNVVSALYNKVTSVSESRSSLSRNLPILTMDQASPTYSVESLLEGDTFTISVTADDDVLVQDVRAYFDGVSYSFNKMEGSLYQYEFDLANDFVLSDFDSVEVIVVDFNSNTTSAVHDLSI